MSEKEMQRGWKKEKYDTPDIIWNIDLSGSVFETEKGEVKEIKVSGANVKMVYMYLVRCLEVQGEVFPSYATIAKFTQISRSACMRSVKVLEEIGLIEKRIRKTEDKENNQTNKYIIYHPKQVHKLKVIDHSQPNDMVPPWNQNKEFGSSTVEPNKAFGSSTMEPNSLSTSIINNSVCVEFEKVKLEWKDCFGEEMQKTEYTSLMKYTNLEFLVEQIRIIKKFHDINKIVSPFAFVIKCIERGGYKAPKQRKVTKKKETSNKPKRNKDLGRLPRSERTRLEQKEVKKDDNSEELEAKKARIQEKIKEMNEAIS